MRDEPLNQGAGLHSLAAPSVLRVVTLVSHGDRAAELPLLWNLCAAWDALGYSVAVLDVTDTESEDQPGLEQLLDDSYWHGDPRQEQMAWAVLPAAQGVARLCRADGRGRLPLQQLGGWFPQHEIVLIYANAATVASALADSGVEPVLALSGNRPALLSVYQGLKQLLLKARLQPTIISVSDESFVAPSAPSHLMSENLQSCAMTFLGYPLPVLSAQAPVAGQRMTDDMSQLALRLLEKALALHRNPPHMPPGQRLSAPPHFARSH